jgi:hypothetical protein
MSTLEKIKQTLRISHNKLDDVIQADIDGTMADLQLVGVKYKDEDDPLIFNAIQLRCRSLYTDDPAKADVWRQRYERLKACLMAAEGYGWEAGADE